MQVRCCTGLTGALCADVGVHFPMDVHAQHCQHGIATFTASSAAVESVACWHHVMLTAACPVLPCPTCREYTGHASHVMMVRFAPNNRWLVSVGGRDRAVFQWRLVRQVQEQGPARREPTAGVFHYGLNRAAQDAVSDASLVVAARPAPVVPPAAAAAPPAPRQQLVGGIAETVPALPHSLLLADSMSCCSTPVCTH